MRRIAVAALVVLACVLPAVAVASWWVYGQVTDTARFVETAKPLATDPTVRSEVVDELVAAADRELGALPGGAAVEAPVRSAAEAVVRSPAYRVALLATIRTTHARLAARLEGDVDAPLRLDLARIAAILRQRVAAAGLPPQIAAAIPDPPPETILSRAEVRRARDGFDTLRIVRAVTIPGAVLALLGVLLTAPSLARGLLRAGACLAVATLLGVAGWIVVRSSLDASGISGDLGVAVYDVLTHPLRSWAVGGGVAAVACALAGAGLSAARRG